MKKLINISAIAIAIATPWLALLHENKKATTDLSCIANYEIFSTSGAQVEIRSTGSLLNDFNSDGEVFIRYAGNITLQDHDTLTHYKVHRDARLNYKLIYNYISTTTIETHRSLSDNSPDYLVNNFVHTAFQDKNNGRAFMYKLSDEYWAIGFKDSPRILCRQQ